MRKLFIFLFFICFVDHIIVAASNIKTYNFYQYSLIDKNNITIVGLTDKAKKEKELIIPEKIKDYYVTSIENGAFSGCTGLASVTIPNSVTIIGDFAFRGCTELTSITIPNSVTRLKNGAFKDCRRLTSVTIPNSVTTIDDNAFKDCRRLTSITIPNSVTIIGSAFSGCTGLASVTIPNSVTIIGDFAFEGCTGLTSITIPNSVTIIGDFAFRGCTELTSITIPNSVTRLKNGAFKDCRRLTSVTIPNSVTYIGVSAFEGCTGLTSIMIPNSVTTIDDNAFKDCKRLTSITIPNSVTIIGSAFSGCTGLTSVTIPNSVDMIGNYAFSGCIGLASVTIPNSVTYIGVSAFSGCTGLASVTIPNSVVNIGDYAFSGCTGLTSITMSINIISMGHRVFDGCRKDLFIGREVKGSGTGSCFSIAPSLAITNSHVLLVNGDNFLIVGEKKYPIDVLANNSSLDLALIQVKGYTFPFSFKLSKGDIYSLGKNIYALGFPVTNILGQDIRVTNGAINAKSGIDGDRNQFQISAAIQPGNSGGPVIYADDPSTVIGVVEAKISDIFSLAEMGTVMQNVNFAIKSEIVVSEYGSYCSQGAKRPSTLDEAVLATGLIYSSGIVLEPYEFKR